MIGKYRHYIILIGLIVLLTAVSVPAPSVSPVDGGSRIDELDEVVFSEDFEDGLPDDWTVVDLDGGGVTWALEEQVERDDLVPNYMIINAVAAGPGTADNMISPSFDCSELTQTRLRFDYVLAVTREEYCWVAVSVDGGDNWTNVAMYSSNGAEFPVTVNLGAYADGEDDVRVAFRYDDSNENGGQYWAIDNVRVSGLTPTESADLLVSSIEIEPDTIGVGDSVRVSLTIFNEGLTHAGPFNVEWFYNRQAAPDVGDYGDYTFAVEGGLASLDSVTVEGAVRYRDAGTMNMYFVLDTEDQIEEEIEDNNVDGPYRVVVTVPTPSNLSAEIDPATGRVTLNWEEAPPIGLESLIYDDGIANSGLYFNENGSPGSAMATRFTPPGDCRLLEVSAYLYHSNEAPLNDINWLIFEGLDEDRTGERVHQSEQIELEEDGWQVYDASDLELEFEDDFWVAVAYPEPGGPLVGFDTDEPHDMRSYYSGPTYFWTQIAEGVIPGIGDGDLMIRATVVVDNQLVTLELPAGDAGRMVNRPWHGTDAALTGEETENIFPSLAAPPRQYSPPPHSLTRWAQRLELPRNSELDELVGYNIYRNLDFIDQVADTFYLDQLNEYGRHVYTVTAEFDEGESPPTNPAEVIWNDPDPDVLIFDLDLTPSSAVGVRSILSELGYSWGYYRSFDGFDDLTGYDQVFVFLGMVQNGAAYIPTGSDEEAMLIDYLDSGGSLFIEGGGMATFNPPRNLMPYFHLTGVAPGGHDLAEVHGEDLTWTEDIAMQYNGRNRYVGHIEPGDGAVRVLHNPLDNAGCGVIYASREEPMYHTAAFTFETGNLVDGESPNTRSDLVSGLMDFFQSTLSSLSGTVTECNEDGNPVEGVTIYADNTVMDTTDAQGWYSFPIHTGNHGLVFSHPDYLDGVYENVRVSPGGTTWDAVVTYPVGEVELDEINVWVNIGPEGDSTGSTTLQLENSGCGPLHWEALLHVIDSPPDGPFLGLHQGPRSVEEVFATGRRLSITPGSGGPRAGNGELDGLWDPWQGYSWDVEEGIVGVVVTGDRIFTCAPSFLQVYDLEGRVLRQEPFPEEMRGIRDLAWDGRKLYGGVSGEGIVYSWHPGYMANRIILTLEAGTLGRGIALDPETGTIYVSDWEANAGLGKLVPRGANRYDYVELDLPLRRRDIYGMAWMPVDPDGKNLWLFTRDGGAQGDDARLYRYDPYSGQIDQGTQVYESGLAAGGIDISNSFDPGNYTIATCASGERVDLWVGYPATENVWFAVDESTRSGTTAANGGTSNIIIRVNVSEAHLGAIPELNYGDVATGELFLTGQAWEGLGPITVNVTFQETAVDETRSDLPERYALHQNYPNPFNPETIIRFDLVRPQFVRLEIYNILGQRVKSLVNERLEAGYHAVPFHAEQLAAGLYFYRIEAGPYSAIRKMVLVK